MQAIEHQNGRGAVHAWKGKTRLSKSKTRLGSVALCGFTVWHPQYPPAPHAVTCKRCLAAIAKQAPNGEGGGGNSSQGQPYTFMPLKEEEAQEDYPNLLATIRREFPALTTAQAVRMVSLVAGTCGFCFNAPNSCDCQEEEGLGRLHHE